MADTLKSLEVKMEEKFQQMKAEYEAKIRELKEGKAAAPKTREETEADKRLEEYVEVKLMYDGDKYKDDVYVAVNGENCRIKRGQYVRIKRKFAEVLDQSLMQDIRAINLINGERERFENDVLCKIS